MNEENLTIHGKFSRTVLKFPRHTALQIKKNNQWIKFSYKDLEVSSLKVATFLIKEGFRKGECAGLILENRPEWAIIYLGIMYAGLTCVPQDPQLNAQELKNLILDSQAKIIFCSYNIFIAKLKENIQQSSAKFILLDAPIFKSENLINFSDIEGIVAKPSAMPDVSPEDIASLIYTSGTTAKPKGVLLSHKNICSNFMSIQKLNLCFPSDNILSILPLHHTYAFMVTLIVPLFLGAKITYAFSFKPQDLSCIIQESGVTLLIGVPQLFYLLHKAIFEKIKNIPPLLRFFLKPWIKAKVRRDLGRSLRLMVSGGARLEPDIARDLSKLGFRLIEGYGLTETSPVVTLNPLEKIKFGSVGKPIPDVWIKINNPDGSGVGEVLIKGENVMQGYFKQPQLTSLVLKEGWFYSGDMGYIDEENYLFLVGREKEVIVLSSGKNIYPEELEEYYGKSPYIKEICILSHRQESFGHFIDSLYAVVVPNLETFKQKNETDIRGKIRWELENLGRNLPSYKHIMGFTVIKEELPRTALKKIKRYEVREKYSEGRLMPTELKKTVFSKEDSEILNKDIAKKIVSYISKQLNKSVYLDSHLEIDLGIDSLTRVELGLGLEALLNLKIPDELLYSISTVREVIVNIESLLQRPEALGYETEGEKNWSQLLSKLSEGTIFKKIRLKAGLLDNLFVLIFKGIILFIFRVFWLLKIKGRKFLPARGPYLICSNHASYLDGFAIFSCLPLNCAANLFFLGYSKIFEHPLVNWTVKTARLISIDPNLHLTEAMQAVSFVLRNKKIVCIFPEGHRSIDESVDEFKKGVGILIKELDIPVVPVYIKGSHRSWPRGSRMPRFCPLTVIFGRSLTAKELMERQEHISDKYEAIAKALRQEVLKLAC